MNNTQKENTPSSGSVKMLLATSLAGRFFRTLGSKPVTLGWDVMSGIISIKSDQTPTEVILEVPAREISRATFTTGAVVLRANNKLYDMEIRASDSQTSIAHDGISMVDQTIFGMYTEQKSDIQNLKTYLKTTNQNSTTLASIKPAGYIAIAIIVVTIWIIYDIFSK